MVTPELLTYITSRTAAGKTRDEITAELIMSGGWLRSDITEGFNKLAMVAPAAPPRIRKPHSAKRTIRTTIIILALALAGYIALVATNKVGAPIPLENIRLR